MIFAAEAEARLVALRELAGAELELHARLTARRVSVSITNPATGMLVALGGGATFGEAVAEALAGAERETNDGGSR